MKILNYVYTKQDLKLCIHKEKGQLTVFAIIIIGIVIAMYLMGFTSPFINGIQDLLKGNTENLFENLADAFVEMVTSPSGLGMLGIALAGIIVASALSGGSGFLFGVGILILVLFSNYFILPTTYIYEQGSWGEAEILKTILVLILNTILVLGMISFIRSGET